VYKAFAPAEARRLADRLELHYTSKHGSWLKMAEIELSVLAKQYLDRCPAKQTWLDDPTAAPSRAEGPLDLAGYVQLRLARRS
jgi:hypothetical protein